MRLADGGVTGTGPRRRLEMEEAVARFGFPGHRRTAYIAFRSSMAMMTMPITDTNQAAVRSQAMPAT